jgi:hypothetical protein
MKGGSIYRQGEHLLYPKEREEFLIEIKARSLSPSCKSKHAMLSLMLLQE